MNAEVMKAIGFFEQRRAEVRDRFLRFGAKHDWATFMDDLEKAAFKYDKDSIEIFQSAFNNEENENFISFIMSLAYYGASHILEEATQKKEDA